ncbi:unnamed protein product [Pleuronectes platessa]|uniref:Uncharacterized protein n=1 Tax=Pleuronectes platessa TaxID=8262 RepID=A0A9N7V643_PLEPL|nr:unnamed protein product [Pleuronectes platessa]
MRRRLAREEKNTTESRVEENRVMRRVRTAAAVVLTAHSPTLSSFHSRVFSLSWHEPGWLCQCGGDACAKLQALLRRSPPERTQQQRPAKSQFARGTSATSGSPR